MRTYLRLVTLCFLALSFLFVPTFSRAATIGLIPANTTVRVGETFR